MYRGVYLGYSSRLFISAIHDDAQAMLSELREALPTAPLPSDQLPTRQTRRLEPGSTAVRQYVTRNRDEVNSALELYYQASHMSYTHVPVARVRAP